MKLCIFDDIQEMEIMHFPFDKEVYLKALKHAFGLAIVGFAIILIGWGEITPTDYVGMALTIPLLAYLIHVIMLFGNSDA